jgi:hypothetical protein
MRVWGKYTFVVLAGFGEKEIIGSCKNLIIE